MRPEEGGGEGGGVPVSVGLFAMIQSHQLNSLQYQRISDDPPCSSCKNQNKNPDRSRLGVLRSSELTRETITLAFTTPSHQTVTCFVFSSQRNALVLFYILFKVEGAKIHFLHTSAVGKKDFHVHTRATNDALFSADWCQTEETSESTTEMRCRGCLRWRVWATHPGCPPGLLLSEPLLLSGGAPVWVHLAWMTTRPESPLKLVQTWLNQKSRFLDNKRAPESTFTWSCVTCCTRLHEQHR